MLKNVRFVMGVYIAIAISALMIAGSPKDASVRIQGFTPLIVSPDYFDLKKVKEQIKSAQIQTVCFDVAEGQESADQFQRKGFLVKRANSLGTVLICHGYLGCKLDAIALKHLFPFFDVMVFDFRAHGELIENQYCTMGKDEAQDVIGAVKFIKSDPQMSKKPIIAYGYSMGAAAAIEAQAENGGLFDAMILDCPFDSSDNGMRRGLMISILGKQYPIPGQEFIIKHMYDAWAQPITSYLFKKITAFDGPVIATKFKKITPVESIKKVYPPCLFIHCDNDTRVPTQAVQAIYHNKPGYKEMWITPGKGHFGSYYHDPELYWYRVNKFLHRIVAQDIAQRRQEKIYDGRLEKIKRREV